MFFFSFAWGARKSHKFAHTHTHTKHYWLHLAVGHTRKMPASSSSHSLPLTEEGRGKGKVFLLPSLWIQPSLLFLLLFLIVGQLVPPLSASYPPPQHHYYYLLAQCDLLWLYLSSYSAVYCIQNSTRERWGPPGRRKRKNSGGAALDWRSTKVKGKKRREGPFPLSVVSLSSDG